MILDDGRCEQKLENCEDRGDPMRDRRSDDLSTPDLTDRLLGRPASRYGNVSQRVGDLE